MSHSIIKAALKSLPAKATAELKEFLECFATSMPREDLEMMDPAMLALAAEKHLALSKKRKPGETKIEIFIPEKPSGGTAHPNTVIEIINDDMAFLVDSIAAEITHNFKLIHLLVHPLINVSVGKDGKFAHIDKEAKPSSYRQSHIHIELQGTLAVQAAKELEERLRMVIADVRVATRDWQTMRQKLRDCEEKLKNAPTGKYSTNQVKEYLSFLDYLYSDNFTLLGYREYKFSESKGEVKSQIVKNSSLGLLHDQVTPVFISDDQSGLSADLQKYRKNLPPLSISKVNKRSTVHRSVPLDAVAVKQYDEKGNVTGECLFIGLFTSVTYSRSIQDVPLLRRRTEKVMQNSRFTEGSHDFKSLRHVLEKYPRDELFQMTEEQILETGVSIMRLQEQQRIALYTRPDPFGRYVSCLVYVPRDRYDTRLRLRIHEILEESFEGEIGDFYTNLDDSPLARIMFVIYVDQKKKKKYDLDAIEAKLQEAGRLWGERLHDAMLAEGHEDQDTIGMLVMKYGDAFPVGYREQYEPRQAIFDLYKVEEALQGTLALDLYKCKTCVGNEIRLKVYKKGAPVGLSAILPTLENMGLRVESEMPFEIKPADTKASVWIHDFMMTQSHGTEITDIDAVKRHFEEALQKIWADAVENDSLNALILNAKMDWRSVMILRTYVRYMRQMGSSFGHRYIAQALNNNANIAQMIIDLFEARHDPAIQGKMEKATEKLQADIEQALEAVASLDEDRILRSLTNLVMATLRTNFYQLDENGEPKTYLAIKMNSARIKDLPKPVPYREIFVYSPRVEGIHLRGDVIARGGIRWSDRHEDFRTEVLGLMKAQQVKNSVIVPMGAKGGFVVKRPPLNGDRKAQYDEGVACYKRFISGLLDITDNRKGKKVVPPKDVVRHDGDDPYLVVAADKGTATFSDIANGLSQDYGFWLDDAFASGGSAGYDHKEMGITARGAWESVKRHFREMNHDTQSKDFDVVGVGDMGGDVFGNGMLLSEHIRLIGAFNHLHIFCDPNPDAASSFKERKRLFEGVKGWGEYDEKKLSKGGRIYNRSDKSLTLTPEIMQRFDIQSEKVPPSELMKAMLKARTDLLWFGGIGTYIKAKEETHEMVGDKANDAIRINAAEVRAHVLGEGANLAVTQAGRINYAEKGGKVNADFIDNAGGVDSSDHEVNIKILMTEVMSHDKHKMTLKKRDQLLEKMTDDIAHLVLRNNYQQAQAISLMERTAAKDLEMHADFIDDLERDHGISREVEGLPSREEIEKRLSEGHGLTRPELSIIQAYSKILFSKDMLRTDIPDMPEMQDYWLLAYFPERLRDKYSEEILSHRLRREIVATTLASSLVNRMGPTFIKKIMNKTGASCGDVALAYLVVREAFDIRSFWDDIEKQDGKVPAEVQLRSMQEIARMMERETIWILMKLGRKPDVIKDINDFGKGVATLYKNMDKVVPEKMAYSINRRKEAAINDGLPADLAHHISVTPKMGASFDIIKLSMEREVDQTLTARVYFAAGSHFRLDWLRRQARHLNIDSQWAAEAVDSLLSQLYSCQVGLTDRILQDMKLKGKSDKNMSGQDVIERWMDEFASQSVFVDSLLNEIQKAGATDIPMLLIAEQRIRQLYER